MYEIVEMLPKWREVVKHLDDQESILLIAPRHYGKRFIFDRIIKDYVPAQGAFSLVLSSALQKRNEKLNYQLLWEITRRRLGVKRRVKVVSGDAFKAALMQAIDKLGKRLVVLIEGAGKYNEDNHFELVSQFDSLLQEYATSPQSLSVVATDDYSLFYHAKTLPYVSDWRYYHKLHYPPLEFDDVFRCVAGLMKQKGKVVPVVNQREAAKQLMELCGGHVGILQDALVRLDATGWISTPHAWVELAKELWSSSQVIASLHRALEEDFDSYSQTALEYENGGFPEPNSSRIHFLLQLGILQRISPLKLRLCPGMVTNLMRDLRMHVTNSSIRVGTLIGASGERRFVPGEITLTDDDFLVVHLSDLHVSENYRYRLAWSGKTINPDQPTAAELLSADLKKQGLLGRVDVLILSGDMVWNGTSEEFFRCREVIKEILDSLCLDASQLVVIPGNHDLQWNPGKFAASSNKINVSRENYDMFLELIGKQRGLEAELTTVLSRSRRNKLRILGLDSNRVEGPDAAGIGFISGDVLRLGAQLLDKDSKEGFDHVYTWLVAHHHIFPATSARRDDAELRKISVMANSAEIQDMAGQWLVDLILHGHEHQPSITEALRWPAESRHKFARVSAIGAGSFGAAREFLGPFSRNHYFVVYRLTNEIVVRSRWIGDNGLSFVPHSDMTLSRPQTLDARELRNPEAEG